MPASWLGIDIGTSSVKAELLTGAGTVLGRGSASLQTIRAAPRYAEQDPIDYVHTAAAAAREACSALDDPAASLGGIGVNTGTAPDAASVAPGDLVNVDFGPLGLVEATFS